VIKPYIQLVSIIADSPVLSDINDQFPDVEIINREGFRYCYRELAHQVTKEDLLLAYKFNQFTHGNEITTIPFQFKPLDKKIEEVVSLLDLKKVSILTFLEKARYTEAITFILSLAKKPPLPPALINSNSVSIQYIKERYEQNQIRLILEKAIPQIQASVGGYPQVLESQLAIKDDYLSVIIKIKRATTDKELLKIFDSVNNDISIRILVRTPHYAFTEDRLLIKF
jgi:hypothetical protein